MGLNINGCSLPTNWGGLSTPQYCYRKENLMAEEIKTIAQIVKDKEIPMIAGIVCNSLELVSRTLCGDEVANLLVDGIYQRMVDPGRIKKYGQLNPSHLTATILAERPDGTLYIIDGQNKACLYSRSGETDIKFHCLVFVHEKDSSVGYCRKIEAEIYKNINENLKSLSTLQKIRSGVVFGDPESCWVERVMNELNLTCNGFGSQNKGALEVLGFNQFFIMVTKTFPQGANDLVSEKNIGIMQNGLELYRKMWAGDPHLNQAFTNKKRPSIYGNVLRGCVLAHEYGLDVLENGQSIIFDKFLDWKNFNHTNAKAMGRKIGGDFLSARRFLWDGVLDQLSIYINNNGLKGRGLISDKTHAKALKQWGLKFSNPTISHHTL